MFVDFVLYPTHEFTSQRTYNIEINRLMTYCNEQFSHEITPKRTSKILIIHEYCPNKTEFTLVNFNGHRSEYFLQSNYVEPNYKPELKNLQLYTGKFQCRATNNFLDGQCRKEGKWSRIMSFGQENFQYQGCKDSKHATTDSIQLLSVLRTKSEAFQLIYRFSTRTIRGCGIFIAISNITAFGTPSCFVKKSIWNCETHHKKSLLAKLTL